MRVLWGWAAFAITLLLALKQHLSHLLDPWRFDGDARQHVFWAYRFADSELFPNDRLVDFITTSAFEPLGYVGLHAVLSRHFDALLVSKVLGFVLSLFAGFFAYRIGRRIAGPAAGLLAVLVSGFLIFDNLRGGLPRAFAFPILLLFLDGLTARALLQVGLAIVLSGLFYPPIVFNLLVLLPLLVFVNGKIVKTEIPRVLIHIAIALALAWIAVDEPWANNSKELHGTRISAAVARTMPEFHEGGRAEFWVSDGIAFYLGDGTYSRSACGLLSSQILGPAIAVFLLLLLRRKSFAAPRFAVGLLITGAALFFIAHLLLFKLFLPSRYTIYAWPVGLIFLAVANISPYCEAHLAWVLHRRHAVPLLLTTLGLFLVIAIAAGTSRSKAPDAIEVQLYDAISALPKDIVIAGRPVDLDTIPLKTQRSVLINRELSLPYFKNHYDYVCATTRASLEMLFARNKEELERARKPYRVTHLLLHKVLYDASIRERVKLVDPPFDEDLAFLANREGTPLLAKEDHGFQVLFDSGPWLLVALPQ